MRFVVFQRPPQLPSDRTGIFAQFSALKMELRSLYLGAFPDRHSVLLIRKWCVYSGRWWGTS